MRVRKDNGNKLSERRMRDPVPRWQHPRCPCSTLAESHEAPGPLRPREPRPQMSGRRHARGLNASIWHNGRDSGDSFCGGGVEDGRRGVVMGTFVYVWGGVIHSNAYSTATEQASLAIASVPCCLRLCSVSKEASHAGHECRPREETLDGATDRERFDDCDAYMIDYQKTVITFHFM
jgi:hypothetical protein